MQVFEFQNHTQGEAFEFQPQIDQNYPLVGIQNHPLGEAFRKIMLNFKIKLHPGSEIFEKVALSKLPSRRGLQNASFRNTKSPSRRGFQKNHAQLQKQVASR